MLVQQRPTWTCKNPRCINQIVFGSYCPTCIRLVYAKKLPDSIICKKCNKEVKIRNLTNDITRKRNYCDDCIIIYRRETSLNYYHTVKKKDKTQMLKQKERSRNYYYSVTRTKKLNKFLEGNV